MHEGKWKENSISISEIREVGKHFSYNSPLNTIIKACT